MPTSLLQRASRNIPSRLKPPIAVVLNLGLSALLGYLASPWIGSDLAAIDRPMKTLSDYSSLIAWRIVEMLSYWIGGWEAYQAASLSALSLMPGLYYFHTYHPSHAPLLPTLVVSSAVNILSVYLPMRFLRPGSYKRYGNTTRNTTALLSAVIYELVLQVASKRFLTTWLLGSGWELESVASVHTFNEALLLTHALTMLPIGYAATDMIFYSYGDGKKQGTSEEEDFKGLLGYVMWLWVKKLSPRTRRVIKRTSLVATYQAAAAAAGVAGTVKGGNLVGAAGLGATWAVATAIVGLVLGWVGKL